MMVQWFRGVALAGIVVPAVLAAQDVGIKVGAAAPDATVETLGGTPVTLASLYGKTPVLIEFWATWCPNCEELEASLKRLGSRYRGRLAVVGVTVSVNQTPERVKRYAQRHGLTHTILYDRKGDASEAYLVPATSYVVIVGSDRRIAYTGLGGDQDLERAVERVLAAEASARRSRPPAAAKPAARRGSEKPVRAPAQTVPRP